MSKAIPAELSKSAALAFVVSQGWNWEGPEGGQVRTGPSFRLREQSLLMLSWTVAHTAPTSRSRRNTKLGYQGDLDGS